MLTLLERGRALRPPISICVCSGTISAKGMREFRGEHSIRQKKGEPPKQPPLLPSDKNKMHTYGKPSSLKTEEEVRVSGCVCHLNTMGAVPSLR